jgi:hypothetical protein
MVISPGSGPVGTVGRVGVSTSAMPRTIPFHAAVIGRGVSTLGQHRVTLVTQRQVKYAT